MTPARGPDRHERLRRTHTLLKTVDLGMESLRQLLTEVRSEVEAALREEAEETRDDELLALRREVDQLREALASRGVIERAKGMLMTAHSLSESRAFDLLNELSQQRHRKLRDVAADITNGHDGRDTVADGSGPLPAMASDHGGPTDS